MTILARAATLYPERTALVFRDTSLTYRELEARANRVANGLLAWGIEPGDRVAVLARNRLEWVDVFFAIAQLGAICVPVNILLRPREVAKLCEDAEVRAIVVDGDGARAVEEWSRRPDIIVQLDQDASQGAEGVVALASLLDGRDTSLTTQPRLDDPMAMYYSSGTTGEPKAAVHTHSNVLWNNYHQVSDLGLTSRDRYLVVPSLSWAAGLNDVMIALFWIGGTNILAPSGGMTIERLAQMAMDHHVTCALVVPALLKQLLDSPDAQELLRASPLRFAITGSAPVPLPLIEAWQERLPDIALRQAYGLSEFPTIAAILQHEEARERAGWAGRGTSITDIAICREGDQVERVGEGEILLRSMASMTGFWRRPDLTAEAFRTGWLHTGDVGELDEHGFLRITGRKKEMIISGGLNVYPTEVEAVIYEYPGVREVAVIGVPDERWGEVPIAVVVAHNEFDVEGLTLFCRERLAGFKVPKRVLLRAELLPRNPTGKLVKRDLLPWATSHLGMESGE